MYRIQLPQELTAAQEDMVLLTRMARVFSNLSAVTGVRVFGSCARWLAAPLQQPRPTRRSDVDVLLVAPLALCWDYTERLNVRKQFGACHHNQWKLALGDVFGDDGASVYEEAGQVISNRFSGMDVVLYPQEVLDCERPQGDDQEERWMREVIYSSVQLT